MATDVSAMPTDAQDVYLQLEEDVIWLHGRWIMYRQLFGTNTQRIDVMNETAPLFFNQLQTTLLDATALEIARITDPPEMKKRKGVHEQLVLGRLIMVLDGHGHDQLVAQLNAQLTDILRVCKPIRDRRNRRIAHRDLGTAIGADAVPGLSRQNIEDALKTIRDFMNAILRQFTGSPLRFEDFIMKDDGDTLILQLRRALAFKALARQDHSLHESLPHKDA